MKHLLPVGYYDRHGQSECGEPSLQESVSETPHPDEEKIVHYLKSGACLAGCGGVEKDILNPATGPYLSLDILTDGVWEWPAYLPYYVNNYHLRLPEAFVARMRANNWTVPEGLDLIDYLPEPPTQ
jgi:hypothetical protein